MEISIVMAILLCRRICMATRGCTSRAASREPQIRRVSWTRMRRTPALAHRRLKRQLTARGSIARSVRVVKTLSEFERPDHTVLTTSDAWETDIENQGHDPAGQTLDVEQITPPETLAVRCRREGW